MTTTTTSAYRINFAGLTHPEHARRMAIMATENYLSDASITQSELLDTLMAGKAAMHEIGNHQGARHIEAEIVFLARNVFTSHADTRATTWDFTPFSGGAWGE